ncbi:restriction endonuclease [Methylobacterium sp. WL30]|uniref:restriction endonuclease n=1 Tax=unclassified Methylobacterium TaxID=2615210 RepID=UPI0011CCA9E8|nr:MULTISPECIES: restriction endonuclease [unclassified Methylobacterium]TXN33417.1 restriction endonuclease [Methylobacterium sp. WL93]TXN51799.1 restriction endonuclease [Methylobacterium sp. WL119]TXN70285.1 restriction endonuclease [Methylobacterium sp. WL30]
MPTIYALKGPSEKANLVTEIRQSLNDGEGRFGWSYLEEGHDDVDLKRIATKIKEFGRESLTPLEIECNQAFLLGLEPGDWVIYINVPSYGRCTMAQVNKAYYWKHTAPDFNHRFGVDPTTVREFDRNDASVQPALKARLVLQGRWWRIYMQEEFEFLRAALVSGLAPQPRSQATSAALLGRQIEPLLIDITRRIQHTHPNYDLEVLLEQVFKLMPGVRRVTRQGGAGDHGADLIVEYESGLPIPSLQSQHTCVVQVKSYTGTHWDLQAVKDIERAFIHYPIADMGLIISTADSATEAFDAEIQKLRRETGKRVELLIGPDVARMILRFGDAAFFASNQTQTPPALSTQA